MNEKYRVPIYLVGYRSEGKFICFSVRDPILFGVKLDLKEKHIKFEAPCIHGYSAEESALMRLKVEKDLFGKRRAMILKGFIPLKSEISTGDLKNTLVTNQIDLRFYLDYE